MGKPFSIADRSRSCDYAPGSQFSQEEKLMNANVAIQVLPSVLEDEEIVRIVDEVIDYIRSTGVTYYVGPCETAMEKCCFMRFFV